MSIPVIWFGRFITKASFRKCPSLHQCNWGQVDPIGNVSHSPNWIDWGTRILINLAQNCCKSSKDYIVKQNQIMFHLPQSHHSYPFQPPPLLVQGSKRIACVLGIGMNASINIYIYKISRTASALNLCIRSTTCCKHYMWEPTNSFFIGLQR